MSNFRKRNTIVLPHLKSCSKAFAYFLDSHGDLKHFSGNATAKLLRTISFPNYMIGFYKYIISVKLSQLLYNCTND